jgi:hypothetical protein
MRTSRTPIVMTSRSIAMALLLVFVAVACTDDGSRGSPGATDGDDVTDQQSMTWLIDRLPVTDDLRVDIVAGPLELPVGDPPEISLSAPAVGFDSFGSAPVEKWQTELGVDPSRVTWAATMGGWPADTIVLTGDIDPDVVVSALESTVNPVEISESDGWTQAVIPGTELEAEVAESTYLNQRGRALRYATRDGVLIVSTTDAGLSAAQDAFDGNAPSRGDDSNWLELAERADQAEANRMQAGGAGGWSPIGLDPIIAGILTGPGPTTQDILIFDTADEADAAAAEIERWIELASVNQEVTVADETTAEIALATSVRADRSAVIVATTSSDVSRAPGVLLPTLFCAAEPAAGVCASQPPG